MKKLIPTITIALLLVLSCTQRKESFLVGKWEDIPRIVNPTKRYIWTFKDDNNFTIESYAIDTTTGTDSLILTRTGEYNFKKENLEFRLKLDLGSSGILDYPVNGEYWVDELERNLLKMTRDTWISDTIEGNPFIRRELLKL